MVRIINLKELLLYLQFGCCIPIAPKVKLKGVTCSASRVQSVLDELKTRKENIVVLLYVV